MTGLCLSDEQMSNGWPFSLLNDKQRVATRWGWFTPTRWRWSCSLYLTQLYHSCTRLYESKLIFVQCFSGQMLCKLGSVSTEWLYNYRRILLKTMPMIHLLNSWWDHVWSWKLIRIQLNLNCHVEMNYACAFSQTKTVAPCHSLTPPTLRVKKRWSFFFNAARAISLELSITNLQFSQAAEPWKFQRFCLNQRWVDGFSKTNNGFWPALDDFVNCTVAGNF